MRANPELAAVLHAVGLPAAFNEEVVREAVLAIAGWRRWNQAAAAKWLRARAVAAQESGAQIDRWWFINGLYRDDPRSQPVEPAKPAWDENCRRCSGQGWVEVTRAHPSGKVETLVIHCKCWGMVRRSPLNSTPEGPFPSSSAVPLTEDSPVVRGLANAKKFR